MGNGREVAGQPLPFSRMTAATVPLQAQYGEVSFTRRSKPALTTAAQRCSWVRMFSAHEGEGRGGVGAPQAVPLPSPQGSGQQGPTYLHSGRWVVKACWGPLGTLEERQRDGSPWVPGSALFSFVPQEAKRFHCWVGSSS